MLFPFFFHVHILCLEFVVLLLFIGALLTKSYAGWFSIFFLYYILWFWICFHFAICYLLLGYWVID